MTEVIESSRFDNEFEKPERAACRRSLETEEGELEAGELCEDSYSEPAMKRMRVAKEAIY